MKGVKVEVRLDSDKIITGIKTSGYDKNNLSDQFEILGIFENMKELVKKRIKRLSEIEK